MNFEWFDYENSLMNTAMDIRMKVFVYEQGYKEVDEKDDIDFTAKHVVGYLDNVPACTARVFFEKPNVMHVGRICVLKDFRGKKVGAMLMQEIENYALKLGDISELELGSQVPKQGFYKACGYNAFGDEFDDAGTPHIMMNKMIK